MKKSREYTLRTQSGEWLGQIVITEDGMFASVTDYGNLSYSWRSFGSGDFRQFLCQLNLSYFAGKMYAGMTYMCVNKKLEKACYAYAERILPVLQSVLSDDLLQNPEW